MAYNWDFYQIPAVGVDDATLGEPTQTRQVGMRISNFGALAVGLRMSDDYTRTQLGFKAKGDLENPVVTYGFGLDNDPTTIHNPYLWGSTVKRVRDDEFTVMTMGSRRTTEPQLPAFDVMDTKLANAAGMEATKKYPSEGWRSFGEKYDRLPYNGVLR